jgi:hypothetical protein
MRIKGEQRERGEQQHRDAGAEHYKPTTVTRALAT